MRKNKKYLIFSVIILSFFVVNYVSAEKVIGDPIPMSINANPTNTPNVSEISTSIKTIKSNSIPPLVQQEIEKIKELKDRTNQVNTSGNQQNLIQERTENGFINMGETQGVGTTINGIKQGQSDQIKNKRIEQIKRYTRNVAERFRALIQREYQIKDRIQTRINKLEESGFDMSVAKQLLLEADTDFEATRNQVELMRNDVAMTIGTSDSEIEIDNLFKKVKEKTISLKRETQNIHTRLVQTVKTIREKVAEKQVVDNSDENGENSNEEE